MKHFIFAIAFVSLSAQADVGEVFSFGRGNVMAGGISNSVDMNLQRHGESEADRYYELNCTKSGLFKKNKLVFKVVDKSTRDVIIQAESKVNDCPQLLRDIYSIAFERKAAAVIALTDEANEKGVRGLRVSFSRSVEAVE